MPDLAENDVSEVSEVSEEVRSPETRTDLVTEKSLADLWRVTVKQLAAMRQRKLRRKYHWEIVNYTVHYTPEGVERLKDLIPEAIDLGEVSVKEDIPAQVRETRRWKVIRIPPNPRMLLVENEWSGVTMWIGVRTNKFFRRGMIVYEEDLGTPDAMNRRHITRRLPRFRGRW